MPSALLATPPTTTARLPRAADDDHAAWDALVARHQGTVRAVVGSFRLQDADVADAVQNTWLRALERIHTVREPDRVGAWLATVARRECLALLARTGREVPHGPGDPARPAAEPGPEALALAADTRAAVGRAVATLPPRRRELVRALFYGPDAGYAAIARTAGLPIGSIGPTRKRALAVLRDDLVRAGHDGRDVA